MIAIFPIAKIIITLALLATVFFIAKKGHYKTAVVVAFITALAFTFIKIDSTQTRQYTDRMNTQIVQQKVLPELVTDTTYQDGMVKSITAEELK